MRGSALARMRATVIMKIAIVALSGSIVLLGRHGAQPGPPGHHDPADHRVPARALRRAPTRRYSYGFKRAEDLVGPLIGLVIAASAALIIWESVRSLSNPREMSHPGGVLAAALIGALGNEAVAIYRIRTGRRIGSAALIAEGQHARTDALTSLAVLIGVAGAWAGVPQLDPIIGLVIAAVIVAVLISSMRTVIRRLMDGVDDSTLDRIETVAAGVEGVVAVDRCRARWIGHRLETDLDISVQPDLSLQDGHAIAYNVHHTLTQKVPHLDRATIHVNPAGIPTARTLAV